MIPKAHFYILLCLKYFTTTTSKLTTTTTVQGEKEVRPRSKSHKTKSVSPYKVIRSSQLTFYTKQVSYRDKSIHQFTLSMLMFDIKCLIMKPFFLCICYYSINMQYAQMYICIMLCMMTMQFLHMRKQRKSGSIGTSTKTLIQHLPDPRK